MDELKNEVSWLHRYATFVACMTFALIVAGALVTSNDAGLSVPDWPTTFGKFSVPPFTGGIKYEFTHRALAGTVGVLMIVLAAALAKSRSPRYVKIIGGMAVFTVIGQAVLGGIGVLFYLPVAVSVSHACLAQIFFCLTVCLALFTRADWKWDEPKSTDVAAPSLRHLAVFTTAAVFFQVVMGAAFRHKGSGIAPHLWTAAVVTACVFWMLEIALNKLPRVAGVRIPAILLAELVVVQLVLGLVAYSMKLNAQDAAQPLPGVVVITTAHVAVGALVLVASLFLTLQTYRYVAPRARAVPVAASAGKITA